MSPSDQLISIKYIDIWGPLASHRAGMKYMLVMLDLLITIDSNKTHEMAAFYIHRKVHSKMIRNHELIRE